MKLRWMIIISIYLKQKPLGFLNFSITYSGLLLVSLCDQGNEQKESTPGERKQQAIGILFCMMTRLTS